MWASLTVGGRANRSNVLMYDECIMLPLGPERVKRFVIDQLRTRSYEIANGAVVLLSEMAELWKMEKNVAKAMSAQVFAVYTVVMVLSEEDHLQLLVMMVLSLSSEGALETIIFWWGTMGKGCFYFLVCF